MKEFTVSSLDAGQRFDKYLKKILPNASMGFLYKMLRKKNIVLNGKKASGNEMIQLSDHVEIYFSEETFQKFTLSTQLQEENLVQYQNAFSKWREISVIYEDADVIFLNKPAGILTQKAEEADLSLNEWLIGYLLANHSVTPETLRTFHPSVCNRLDRNTSGLVLCGKSMQGSQFLSSVLHDRSLHKYYITFVSGEVSSEMDLQGYLHKNEEKNKVTILNKIPDGRQSDYVTIKTRIKPLGYQQKLDLSALEILLITGKSHQIRAHLSSIGHPIVGDRKYGGKVYPDMPPYQLLHAYRVTFPVVTEHASDVAGQLSGKEFRAPLPQACRDMEEKICPHGIQEV